MDGFIALVLIAACLVPVAGFILAIVALGRIRRLEARVGDMDARLRGAPAAAPAPAVTDRAAAAGRTALTAPEEVAAGAHVEAAPEAVATPPEAAASAEAGATPAMPAATATDAASPEPEPEVQPEAPTQERVSWEEHLGARLTVWVGGIALAAAGLFLVKHSIDKGWLGPGVRVSLGVVASLLALAAGEWLRTRSHRVAQAVTAAGVAVLFASLLAAVTLYHLVPTALGFGLLAATTAGAVALSLRQGPFVAGLGLVGGFLTPVIIRTGEPPPGALTLYLLLLQCGLLLVTGLRRWWPLAVATQLALLAWVAGWLAFGHAPGHGPWLGALLLASGAASALAASGAGGRLDWGRAAGAPAGRALAWLGTAPALALGALLVGRAEFSALEWGFFALLSAGALVLARLDDSLHPLAWIAAGVGGLALVAWGDVTVPPQGRLSAVVLLLGGLHAVGGYVAAWGARRPAAWASLSAAASVAYFLIAHGLLERAPTALSWGGVSLLLAAGHALGLVLVQREREAFSAPEPVLAAVATAATAHVSLAVPLELEREWIAVAWAVELPVLAALAGWLGVRQLRSVGAVLAACVLARLLLNPAVFDWPVGDLIVLDWLAYGYGIPAAALLAAAVLFRRHRDDALVAGLELGATALALAWVTLEIRHVFHGARLDAPAFEFAEWGAMACAWWAFGWALLEADARWPRVSLRWGGRAVTGVAASAGLLVLALVENPLWNHHDVGTVPIFNTLLFVYGGPAALALAARGRLGAAGPAALRRLTGACAFVLTFLLVTLEVRHWFHAPFLDRAPAVDAEWYAYSAAWIALGVLLLVVGIRRGSTSVRHAALAVMLLAVLKVFLFDMRHLVGLYRVVSFLGLGISLLVLGHLYQRFVFRAGPRP